MLKKIAFAGLGIALLASPLLASADTASEIQAKINALLAQITQLQEQLRQLTSTNPTPPVCSMEAKICPDGTSVGRTGPNCEFAACPRQTGGVEPAPSRICPQILRTLDQGITGSDVKDLQAYLGVSQTGYFGPMTARAVSEFQADEGLTQVGVVGPQTRAAFARRCGWGNQNFTASPTSGVAPLSVTFQIPATAAGGVIQYGDGAQESVPFFACQTAGIAGPCTMPLNHTYAAAGTYTAELTRNTECGTTNSIPGTPIYCPTTIGAVTITVYGTQPPPPAPTPMPVSFSASPTSGTAPLTVTFAANGLKDGQTYWIEFGDGSQTTLNLICGQDEGPCASGRNYAQTSHSYTSASTYAAKLMYQPSFSCPPGAMCPAMMPAPQTLGTVVITVSGTQPPPPPAPIPVSFSASPTSGQAPLYVTFRSNMTGTVNFGDGTSGQMAQDCRLGFEPWLGGGGSTCDTGSYFVGHTYATVGTYTATLAAAGACSSGYCAQTASVTITVSGGTSGGACEVTDIYAEGVPGYVFYNLFMKVRNLPTTSNNPRPAGVTITGAESWNNLTFSTIAASGDITTLQASQTINGTGINYIMERKYAIKPVSNGTEPITCAPMGGSGVSYPVPPSIYPTQTTSVSGQTSASGTNINVANALTALESALKAIIAKLGQ